MLISRLRTTLLVTAATLLLVVACGKDTDEDLSFDAADSLLRFIPADTPYVVATPGDMPDDVADKLEPQINATLQAYHKIIRAIAEEAYAKAQADDEDAADLEKLLPLVEELGDLMSVEGLREAGVDRDSDIGIYGVGLLPVLRLTLSDGDLLEATIARMEQKAGQTMEVATIDGHSYRYFGDDEGRVVVGLFGDNLVVTLVPSELGDDQFKQILGLSLPAESIVDSGTMQEIGNRYGFNDYMIGLFDVERLVATFLDEPTGINSELLALMDYDASELSDVCKTEIRGVTSVMPRMVMGYTDISTSKLSSKAVIELRDDIASGVSSLTAAVPGLSEKQGGMLSFGMSMDLLAARDFYSARLDALEEKPFECELFADLQSGVDAGREVLNQPVPPIVYGFKGFLAVIDSIEGMDLAKQQPPTSVDMRTMIAMENAEGLLAMGAMFSPDIAGLNLEPDGEPVKLDIPQVTALEQTVFLAMTDNAIGVSVGEGMEKGLADMLNASTADSAPFFTMEMDAERYYGFIGDAMAQDPSDGDGIPEVQEAVREMNESFKDVMDRITLDVEFTNNGIELESEVLLKD